MVARTGRTTAIVALVVLVFIFVSLDRLHGTDYVLDHLPSALHPDSTNHPPPPQGGEKKAAAPAKGQVSLDGANGPAATDTAGSKAPPAATGAGCDTLYDILRGEDLGLSHNIKYTRRCVKQTTPKELDRNVVANITESLFAETQSIDIATCQAAAQKPPPCVPLSLAVPQPYPKKQYPHLVFGVATSYERLQASLYSFAHWMSGSGARLVAVVTDAHQKPENNLTAIQEDFARSGIQVTVVKPARKDLDTPESHFAMIADLLAAADSETKWLGVLDDDTFFPSLYALDAELSKHDHTVPAYLGALSDDFKAIRIFGYMAFGGAGVFLSIPLAKQLSPNIDRCLREAAIHEGDIMLRDCVYAHSRAKLTQIPGLFQQDMHQDAAGFFEGGLRILSVHHWKSWYRENVVAMASVVNWCGDCFLQRWRAGDNEVFTNGYSVASYREGNSKVDLDWVEGTWWEAGHDWDFSIGPIRNKMERNDKKSYKLELTDLSKDGGLRQFYVYRGDAELDETDEVLELYWEPVR